MAVSCGGPPASLPLERSAETPAVYRVSALATSRFSGPVSDLSGETRVTAAFRATPVSEDAVEVEALYLAASVSDAGGEPAALSLGRLTGRRARVEFRPGGQVRRVTGDEELLQAPIPLLSVATLVEGLFPPLPQEATEVDDTWTGDVPSPFPSIGGPPVRTRYALLGADADAGTGTVEGYELAEQPLRPFGSGNASGRGYLDFYFQGEVAGGTGYTRAESTAKFDTRFLRLGEGNTYANGRAHLEQTVTVERLNDAEIFGLDSR